jgi:hypothetical protein
MSVLDPSGNAPRSLWVMKGQRERYPGFLRDQAPSSSSGRQTRSDKAPWAREEGRKLPLRLACECLPPHWVLMTS